MKKVVLRLILLAGGLSASACATIVRGSSEDVEFVSQPAGVLVETSRGQTCLTPCTMRFDRRDTFHATFRHKGQEQTIFVDTEVAGGGVAGVAGNVLFGGAIGVGVDIATGAGLSHSPNPVIVNFDNPTRTEPVPAPAGQPVERIATSARKPEQVAKQITRAKPVYAAVPGSPPLYEGSAYSAFTPDQIAAYCGQDWATRYDASGRTEYNPCKRRDAFS